MLHSIDYINKRLVWYCYNPKCIHHGCTNWHRDIKCGDHTSVETRVKGTPLSVAVDNPNVIWIDSQHVQLPACECGSIMTIRIPTEEESVPATIHRDENNNIIAVELSDDHPAVNFTIIEHRLELIQPNHTITQQLIAHAHNNPSNPAHMQALIDHLTPQQKRVIADVRQHPAVSLHTQAKDLLLAHGNITPPSLEP